MFLFISAQTGRIFYASSFAFYADLGVVRIVIYETQGLRSG